MLAAERFGSTGCVVALAGVAAAKHAKDRGNALPLGVGHNTLL